MRKNFIPRNDGFTCEDCGKHVKQASGTFRNHCPNCLTSKHVDNIPGDRKNVCQGLMPTIAVEGIDPDKLNLMQKCERCRHTQRNKTAPDDNRSVIFEHLDISI